MGTHIQNLLSTGHLVFTMVSLETADVAAIAVAAGVVMIIVTMFIVDVFRKKYCPSNEEQLAAVMAEQYGDTIKEITKSKPDEEEEEEEDKDEDGGDSTPRETDTATPVKVLVSHRTNCDEDSDCVSSVCVSTTWERLDI